MGVYAKAAECVEQGWPKDPSTVFYALVEASNWSDGLDALLAYERHYDVSAAEWYYWLSYEKEVVIQLLIEADWEIV